MDRVWCILHEAEKTGYRQEAAGTQSQEPAEEKT